MNRLSRTTGEKESSGASAAASYGGRAGRRDSWSATGHAALDGSGQIADGRDREDCRAGLAAGRLRMRL